MATTTDVVAHAIGSGLGTATIWFPITYFAVRSQIALRKGLGKAWRSYLTCVALLAILQMLGLEPSTNTPVGLASFFVLPFTVCALVLYLTYREPTDSSRP